MYRNSNRIASYRGKGIPGRKVILQDLTLCLAPSPSWRNTRLTTYVSRLTVFQITWVPGTISLTRRGNLTKPALGGTLVEIASSHQTLLAMTERVVPFWLLDSEFCLLSFYLLAPGFWLLDSGFAITWVPGTISLAGFDPSRYLSFTVYSNDIFFFKRQLSRCIEQSCLYVFL